MVGCTAVAVVGLLKNRGGSDAVAEVSVAPQQLVALAQWHSCLPACRDVAADFDAVVVPQSRWLWSRWLWSRLITESEWNRRLESEWNSRESEWNKKGAAAVRISNS